MSELKVVECEVDDWGEVLNGDGTYHWIAEVLAFDGSVIVGWTDQRGTHLDILFSVPARQCGMLQGGLTTRTDLFVSIMRKGAFGFDTGETDTYHSYIAEKLGLPACVTTEALATLINGVRQAIQERMP